MDIQTLRDRYFYLGGQAEEAKRILEAALKESEDVKKEQNKQSTTVDTGHTEVLNSDQTNESK